MSMDTIAAIGRNLLSSRLAAADLSVVWHAGEPTMVPAGWYEEAFVRLAEAAPGRRLTHSFQTNGLAVSDRWIDLWRRWNVRVGISIDGPRDLNDRCRRTRGGAGSFDTAVAGLRRLRAAGFPFHVITVLTREALERADDLLDFYESEGVDYVCFNVEEQEGVHGESSLSISDSVDVYRKFLRYVAERIRARGMRLRCREINGVAWLAAATPEARRHNPQVVPLEIVSVAVDGGMSTFSPEFLGLRCPDYDDFVFGNVHSVPVEAILDHPAFRRLARDIALGVDACRRVCPYFGVCGGGAPVNKFSELGDVRGAETQFCRLTRKAAIDAILPVLEAENVCGT
jgi:uncharacterized protein